MKVINLLHKTEEASPMLIYYYDVHAWRYDCKFWLVNGKWCTDLEGKIVVGKLHDREVILIKQFMPIIEQHEKENENWLAFHKCRKRTCVCKSCNKFCHCANCKEKRISCDNKK